MVCPIRADVDGRKRYFIERALFRGKCLRSRFAIDGAGEAGAIFEAAIKFQPSNAVQDDCFHLKAAWCKGGRARTLPITNDLQRRFAPKAELVLQLETQLHSRIVNFGKYMQNQYLSFRLVCNICATSDAVLTVVFRNHAGLVDFLCPPANDRHSIFLRRGLMPCVFQNWSSARMCLGLSDWVIRPRIRDRAVCVP
jgi:hypothetical protein